MRQAMIRLAICLMCLAALPAQAAERAGIKAYFFGNSLVEHPSETHETSTVYWLGYIAKATSKQFAGDGMWGFLREYGTKLPAISQWSVPGVRTAWRGDLGSSGYDAIVLTPTNFIQYQAADKPYEWENPQNISPLQASRQVFDYVIAEAPKARLFIYEGWADMAGVVRGFPPSQRQLAKYHRFNGDDYHDWYVDYAKALGAAYPDNPPKLIPIASVLSEVFADPALKDLEATDLYSDDAPHGTPSMYFLAALVTYAVLYDVAPPASLVLPSSIHPLIRANYGMIATKIAEKTGTERAALTGGGAVSPVAQPALAMGLDGIHDWSTQYPFINVMKTARPWLGHIKGQWGGFDAARLEDEGYLDENGWPMEIPEGVEKLESYLLTDLPQDAQYFTGRYRLTYEGQGKLRVGGRARNVRYGEGEITFAFEPGDGPVVIGISKTDPADHIRNIVIVHQDHADLYDMGVVFNPAWVNLIRDLRAVRFMDWMITNGSFVSDWQARPRPADYTYGRRGVPVEVMVQLANLIAADPWFTMPHHADDEYVEAFATYVRDHLDHRRVAYVEYSNEMWNFLFEQARWAGEQAKARWNTDQDGAWMQWTGMRAAQMMGIWARVFNDPDRLVRVVSVHTAWPGLEDALLQAPLYVAEQPGNEPPVRSFDAYAVTGYFGLEAGMEDMPTRILRWARQGVATEKLTAFLRDGPLKELTQNLFPYHAKVARENGLDLIMYEGGTHIVGIGEWVDNDDLTKLFNAYNYSSEMGELYQTLLQGWQDAGGTMFNAFVDVAKPMKWGSWGARRHLADQNPRWDALMAYNASAGGAKGRASDAFEDGVFLSGRDGGDVLEGTRWADILMGRGGDDRLIAGGGGDFLLGGDGQDTAVLVGYAADYELALWGQTLLAIGPNGEVALRGIEALEFTAEPGKVMALSLPE